MVSSVNAPTGIGSEPYSSAKAGLGSLAQNLAVQLGPHGIRVNAIAPGTIRTRVWDNQPGGADRMVPLYPLGRVGERTTSPRPSPSSRPTTRHGSPA